MAIPNHTPNDSGLKSLTAYVWRTRSALSKGTNNPKKDGWDKADIAGKFLIAVAIPIAVAIIGGQVQKVVTTQQTGKDYMQMALGILEKKDLPAEMQKNIGLRKWAVDLLNYYSEVKLDNNTANKLVTGDVQIPLVLFFPLGTGL
jgi:hypothetical protein